MVTTPIPAVDARVLSFAPDLFRPVLADVNGYPQWYPPSLQLHVRAVTAEGIGSEVELRPRGGRAFRFRVEALEPPRRLRLRYPGDFIVGTGEWRLDAAPGGTRVAYEPDVGGHRAIGGAAGLDVAVQQNPLQVHARGGGESGAGDGEVGGALIHLNGTSKHIPVLATRQIQKLTITGSAVQETGNHAQQVRGQHRVEAHQQKSPLR